LGVPGKLQDDVFAALEAIRSRLPFVLLELDSDDGGEFLNGNLVRYCAEHFGLRSLVHARSGRTTKRTWEQKNWSIVRNVIGYDRDEGPDALAQLNRVSAAFLMAVDGA